MFQQFKNIEQSFKHIRLFTIVIVTVSLLLSGFAIYQSISFVSQERKHIYILANGKILEAFAGDRKANIPVEIRDHVRTFHNYFFTLDPDEKVIKANMVKALYLADNTAQQVYQNLEEKGYYSNVISANISQEIAIDSISLNMDNYPYAFKCYAKQKIIRSTSLVVRSLITEGQVRNVSRSDNNPHGFLIENWSILDNHDLSKETRER